MLAVFGRALLAGWCLLGGTVEGKFVNDKVKFRIDPQSIAQYNLGDNINMDGLHYITHFACAIGRCSWDIRIRAVNPGRVLQRANGNRDYVADPVKFDSVRDIGIWKVMNNPEEADLPMKLEPGDINMRVILDAEWKDKNLSRGHFTPKLAGKECMGDIESRLTKNLSVPLTGEWSQWYTGALIQKARPHHWYFVLEDCRGQWAKSFMNAFGVKPAAFSPAVMFEYEVRLLNSDGTHFGYEYWGIPFFTFVTGVIAACGLGYFIFKQWHVAKTSGTRVHPIVQSINLALVCVSLYLWLHWFHLMKFKDNGHGHPKLDTLGICLRAFGNIFLLITVFGVSLGYSLDVAEMTIPGEAFLALACCYGLLELLLTFAQYQTHTLRYHIHASEGVIPIIICIFRIALAVTFFFSCEATKNRKDYTNDSVRIFIDKFRWRGLLMLSSTPAIIMMVTLIFPIYHQNRYIEMLCLLADLAAIIYLGVAFLTTKTSFFRASVLGNSLLPFGSGGMSSLYRHSAQHQRID